MRPDFFRIPTISNGEPLSTREGLVVGPWIVWKDSGYTWAVVVVLEIRTMDEVAGVAMAEA